VVLATLGIAGRLLLWSRFEPGWPIVLITVAVATAIVVISGGLRWHGYGREWVWSRPARRDSRRAGAGRQ
jgi:hypothetical protein